MIPEVAAPAGCRVIPAMDTVCVDARHVHDAESSLRTANLAIFIRQGARSPVCQEACP